MRKDITPESTEEILQEMCKRVGADYDSMNFEDPKWFQKYEWTKEEEESFRLWLADYLLKNKYVRPGIYRGQKNPYYQAGKLVFTYGWKYKKEESK